MKHQKSAMEEREDDFVSDFSTFVDTIDFNDGWPSQKEALIFLKVTLHAKENELMRLREEKEAAVESKLALMMDVKQAKSEAIEMSRKLIQAEKEKEAAAIEFKIKLMEMENGMKKELAEMAKMLLQAQNEKEGAIGSKIDLLVEELKLLKKEVAGKAVAKEKEEAMEKEVEAASESKLQMLATLLSQMQKENEEAIDEVKLCRKEIAEMRETIMEANNEKLFASGSNILQAKKDNDAAMESKTDLLIEELKVLQKELREKVEIEKILLQMQKEKNEMIEEVKLTKEEKVEMTRMLITVQKEKEGAIESNLDLKKKLQEAATEIDSFRTRIAELEEVRVPLTQSTKYDYVWNLSGTKVAAGDINGPAVVHALRCPPLKAGTFEWKIRVGKESSFISLGVIPSSFTDDSSGYFIGYFEKTWGYMSSGYAYHDGKSVGIKFPKFSNRSVVRFVLDLTGIGTLRVSVDGSSLVKVFSNMKSSLGMEEGFLPAVSLHYGANIELLSFESK